MPRERTTADDVARSIFDLAGKKLARPKVHLGRTAGGGTTTTEVVNTGGFKNPMRTLGAMIFGGTDGAARQLYPGADGTVLTMVGLYPRWTAPTGGGGSVATRDLLTNGDLDDPQLIFADGDVIWIEEGA